ncbi:MAG: proline--tRNA ligase [Nanoarchaeota archaeon]
MGITVKKDKDFSEWYVQVVIKSGLADYSPVKGCMIIRPHGYSLWENIQKYFNERLKKYNVQNAYFPLFIPESFFKKEAEHAKGFKPEVAWIHDDETGEKLAIRPTSETIMYDAYSKWIRSHRDLPLRLNHWCNIVRWETKATRLFLRTREFLWQEGHCVYATNEECDKETLAYLNEYKKLCEDLLAIPVLIGKKSEEEKFAGADYTLTIESLMPDGKALQMGTSHNLGQNFAKAFNITFLDENSKKQYPYQNSWGFSTRLIGALVMVHGDDKGLIIPPRVASIKGVVIPIGAEKNKDVLKEAENIKNQLEDFIIDDRSGYTPGWKFNEWELKGIPIRLEIGPKDIEKNQIILVRRDTGEKKAVNIKELKKTIDNVLDKIQVNLFDKAMKFLKEHIKNAKNYSEFKSLINNKNMVKANWCGDSACEKKIKDETGASIRLIPFGKESLSGNCIYCNKKSKEIVYFAKAY